MPISTMLSEKYFIIIVIAGTVLGILLAIAGAFLLMCYDLHNALDAQAQPNAYKLPALSISNASPTLEAQ